MHEFRILGPLEVTSENGPIALGGPRQRALLAALLLRAGRVVPTEQLVDELYGAEPPKSATASLQNSVAALRKALGPDVLVTRSPGYVLALVAEQIDARRFEQMLADARSASPGERRTMLRRALALWRGPPLAEFAFEGWAEEDARRLDELRLVALEERIAADVDVGLSADVVPELESLVREHPLRERLCELLMLALYRSGRQADALRAYTDARVALDQLGIEPGDKLRQLQAAILRHEPRLTPGADMDERDADAEIVKAILAGRLVPVLGLDGATDLAAQLAAAFGYPSERPVDLARVSQYVATMNGSGPLYDELHSRFEAAVEPQPVHRFLAALAPFLREHGAPHPLVVSGRYDLALERAFEDAGEEVDVVTYVAAGPNRGKFWHRPPGEEPRPIDVPNTYATELSLERRTVLLKLHGAVDPFPEREWESFVITEDDYIDYLGHSDVAAAVPVALAARLRRSHFLFLGYEMVDWNLRLVMHRVWGDRPVAYRSWAVDPEPTPLERAFWRRFDVDVLDVDPDEYVGRLARRLEAGQVSVASPYRGLAAFDDSELDALYFFGRERDAEIVVANLIASRFTVLYGPSGVGKSSLLLAAVARTLRELPEQPLVVVFSNWVEDPARALAETVAQATGFEAGELLETVESAQAGRDVYLILDQAEEYLTYHRGDDGFEESLAAIVNHPLRVNVLLSLREDTLAMLDRLKADIPALFANVLRLDRLDRVAGRAAIVRPLERWSELEGDAVVAEDALVDRVLDGVGTGRIELGTGGVGAVEQNGSPRGIEAPYLQLVMQRLWDVERGAGSSTLRAETLDALGGAGQIVADHLERAIEALTPHQREIAARLFDHLVTPSGTKIAHEASDLAEFAGTSEADVQPVVATLANHRILRTDESGRWEIFHDVLAGAVLGWKSRHDAERAVARAREEARRRHRRLGLLAFGALLGLALASALAVFAFSQRSDAREQARVAQGGQLVASALSLLESDPELGMAFALEGAAVDPTPRAETALRLSLDASRERAIYAVGRPLVELDVGRSGARAVVVDADHVARMIDLETGRELWSTQVDGAAATFGADERTVLVITRHALRTLDARTGTPLGKPVELRFPGNAVRIVSSRDGRTVIVIAGKPRALVFALPSGARIGRVKHAKEVTAAAFAPSGLLVASSGVDTTARLWETRSWTVTRVLPGHVGHIQSVEFDRSGSEVATSSTDQTARVWRVATGGVVAALFGHTASVGDVSFGPDGVLVTASADGTARTWRGNGRPAETLVGHRGAVTGAAYVSRDRVVTAGADGTIRLWDPGTSIELVRTEVEGPSQPRMRAVAPVGGAVAVADGSDVRLRVGGTARVLRGHRDLVNSVAFSPDGRLLVTAGRDHDVIVWDVVSGEAVHRFEEAHSASVADARFSPDGRWLVTAGPRSARLWHVADWQPLMYLYGPTSRVTAVAFRPDSRTVVTREEDKTVRRYVCELCGGLDELGALARSRLRTTGRNITDADRARLH